MKAFILTALLLTAATGAVGGQVHPFLLGLSPDAVFFDDRVLHEINLVINSRDWQTLTDNYLLNTYYPSDFRWRDQVVRNVGIRSRGNASRSAIKPGLRIDFDRYTTDQKFLGLKSFILRNNTQDASSLHERISMLLFRRLGLPASREAHTKLFVNNAYVGLYTIVESVDKAFLKRNLNENDGYLFTYQWAGRYYFEDRGSDPASYVPLPFKPETHEADPRSEFIVQLVQAINQTGDAAFRTVMAEYLDLKKFIRHMAVERFLADSDDFLSNEGMANFYVYRFQNTKLFTFLAWDKSNAFSDASTSIWHNVTDVPTSQQNRLLARALSYRDLYDLFLDTLMECVRSSEELQAGSSDPRGWLEREVEREYSQIRAAALTDPTKPFTNGDFENAVEHLRRFARARGESVTREVDVARGRTAGLRGQRFE
jgi:spore coat protein H